MPTSPNSCYELIFINKKFTPIFSDLLGSSISNPPVANSSGLGLVELDKLGTQFPCCFFLHTVEINNRDLAVNGNNKVLPLIVSMKCIGNGECHVSKRIIIKNRLNFLFHIFSSKIR